MPCQVHRLKSDDGAPRVEQGGVGALPVRSEGGVGTRVTDPRVTVIENAPPHSPLGARQQMLATLSPLETQSSNLAPKGLKGARV